MLIVPGIITGVPAQSSHLDASFAQTPMAADMVPGKPVPFLGGGAAEPMKSWCTADPPQGPARRHEPRPAPRQPPQRNERGDLRSDRPRDRDRDRDRDRFRDRPDRPDWQRRHLGKPPPPGVRQNGRPWGEGSKRDPPVSPLYKTRLCTFYEAGVCRAGALCGFAHGEADLRESPDFERTSVCPIMLKEGSCNRPDCRYAHRSSDLKASPVMLKTKLCSFHLEGNCVVGTACRFAHSAEELREAATVQQNAMTRLAATPREHNQAAFGTVRADRGPSSAKNSRLQGLRAFVSSTEDPPPPPSPPAATSSAMPAWREAAEAQLQARREAAAQVAQAQAQKTHNDRIREEPFRLVFQPHPVADEPCAGASVEVEAPAEVEVRRESSEEPAPEWEFTEAPSATEPESEPTVAAARGGRVLVEAPALAAEDCIEGAVDIEDTVWRAACITGSLAGVGAAAVLRNTLGQRSVLGRLGRSGEVPSSHRKVTVRAVLDIEDVGELARVCRRCPSASGSACLDSASSAAGDVARYKAPCFVAGDHSAGGFARCGRGTPFPECAMCVHGPGQTKHVPCAACSCGLRVVSKNTFLTMTGADEAEADAEKTGSRRRSLSV